jgi:hypothetical protein
VATKCHRVTINLRKRTDKARVVHLARLYCSYLGSKCVRTPRSALRYRMYSGGPCITKEANRQSFSIITHLLCMFFSISSTRPWALTSRSHASWRTMCRVSNVSPVKRTLDYQEYSRATNGSGEANKTPVPFTITRSRPTSTLNLSRKYSAIVFRPG